MSKMESGKPLHGVELVTGQSLTGTILISESELRADIYSYAGHFHINGEQPVFLQIGTIEIVSLHSNITTILGNALAQYSAVRLTYRQEILSTLPALAMIRGQPKILSSGSSFG
ncbi:hypothetical protein [Bradyrhizobium arachidis]|uniref:hypothetical protein n=1 Tax=Bradyrhizobium arachidis TaxID=858423 RepID=UPI0021628EE7|nr:hypothetical protein [Bradyrhizobium arachidis]UVO30546.1 hypothetical protein KUF59_07720 [Bradyrhizobium arachidis]